HPFAPRHRPGDAQLLPALEALRDGEPPARFAAFLELLHEFAAPTSLAAQALGETEEDILAIAARAPVTPLPDEARPEAWTTRGKWERLAGQVVDVLAHFHRTHPLERGMDVESLRSRLRAPLAPRLFRP